MQIVALLLKTILPLDIEKRNLKAAQTLWVRPM